MPPSRFRNAKYEIVSQFYEPLVLLRLLGFESVRSIQQPGSIHLHIDAKTKLWRTFLDKLSFLCDAEKGGDTVTAIAAQRTPRHTIFWIGSNSDQSLDNAKHHVSWILSKLASLADPFHGQVEQIEAEILEECINFNWIRIKKYAQLFLRNMNGLRINREKLIQNWKDEDLFRGLHTIESDPDDLQTLCRHAYAFRRTPAASVLCEKRGACGDQNTWSYIYHNVWMLGSYSKAVKMLIEAAQIFPQHVTGAWVWGIAPPAKADLPPYPPSLSNPRLGFDAIVSTMVRDNEAFLTLELIHALGKLFQKEARERYKDTYAKCKPRPHAELIVLEHFYHWDLEFVHDIRYIGCSKPSCYCCDLYMKVHPGNFEKRACHGNLYTNWAPPYPLSGRAPKPPPSANDDQRQEHHTFQLLNAMKVYITRDLKIQILSENPRFCDPGRKLRPDSWSDKSSVLDPHSLTESENGNLGGKFTQLTTTDK